MLRLEADGSVLHVTLDRPDVRNAFNDVLIAKLTETFTHLDAKIRAVVLAGEGKAFCAGGDLEWMRRASSYSEEENFQDAMRLGGLFQSIATCHAVVITKVHGAAFGGGCGLIAASDIAIAAEDTKFAFSEVKLGLVAGTISQFVISKIGPGQARALLATGEVFDAARALRIGLVHEVGSESELSELVEAKLRAVLTCGPNAVRESKRITLESPLPLDECARRLAEIRSGPEGKEGVAAFLEKRKASFVEER